MEKYWIGGRYPRDAWLAAHPYEKGALFAFVWT
jgi:hypothetical protein